MNLLAHLHLGEALPRLEAAGNLVADYCKGPFSGAFERGVRLHRIIDSYTDAHPRVADARRLFEGRYRRFGGVICDLAFDYCLSQTWSEWMPNLNRIQFIDLRLDALHELSDEMPDDAANIIYAMRTEGWLHRYDRIDGIGEAIRRISIRRPVAKAMIGAELLIEDKQEELMDVFHSFYPDLVMRALGASE